MKKVHNATINDAAVVDTSSTVVSPVSVFVLYWLKQNVKQQVEGIINDLLPQKRWIDERHITYLQNTAEVMD